MPTGRHCEAVCKLNVPTMYFNEDLNNNNNNGCGCVCNWNGSRFPLLLFICSFAVFLTQSFSFHVLVLGVLVMLASSPRSSVI